MSARLRALLVVPANNTTMEPEMNTLCPALAPFAVARVRRPPRTLTVADLPAYLTSTLEAVEPFLDRQPEVIVYGCTAAGFLGGPAGNARVVAALRARAAGPRWSARRPPWWMFCTMTASARWRSSPPIWRR